MSRTNLFRIVFINILFLAIGELNAQKTFLKNDTFILRSDTSLNYNLNVAANDSTTYPAIKIMGFTKLDANSTLYTLENSSDSSYIHITSSTNNSFTGQFEYYVGDSAGTIDTARVLFYQQNLAQEVYPGETNKDGLVNHLDILPLGVFFNQYGNPRNNLDTNIDFTPKRAGDWFFQKNSLNAKFSDVDGNGYINQLDVTKLEVNIGGKSGTFTPVYSDTNSVHTLSVVAPDTVFLSSSDSSKLKLPLKLNSTQSSYGLGYSIEVLNQNKLTLQDSFFPNYSYLPVNSKSIWNDQSGNEILYLQDKISAMNQLNIAYCKTNGKNGNSGSDMGVVEIVVETVLLGLIEPTDVARLHIVIDKPVMIDKDYRYLPLKPISKTVYIGKASSSIQNLQLDETKVFPTLIDNHLYIQSNTRKSNFYEVYNPLGKVVASGKIESSHHTINTSSWAQGLYFLKINSIPQSYKIFKK